MNPEITALGDSALVVSLADQVKVTTARRTQAASAWLAVPPLPGVTEVVPAATTVTLFYAPLELLAAGGPAEDLAGWLAARVRERLATLPRLNSWRPPRRVDLPVCYGGEFGPDLETVAARVKLTPAQVIQRHSEADYFVLQLGFAPGFPYLHGLPAELALPRRDTPRTQVPAGSVAIANGQAGIYPLATPGGWHLLGRTPRRLFHPDQEPATLLQPGDRVKFHAISPAEFARTEAAP